MLRSKLKNEYNKSQSTEDLDNYKRQRNFCVNLFETLTETILAILDLKNISERRKFKKTIKSYFSSKGFNSNNYLLLEKAVSITNEGD